MSIAEAYDIPAARKPLVPPRPPRAPDNMTAFGRMQCDPQQPDRQLGPARLRGRDRPGPLLRPQQFHPQRAGRDPACAGRQLRELYPHPGRHPRAAADPRRGPADRGRPRLEAPAPDAGARLHAARGDHAGAAYAGGDRRDHRQAQGREQRAGRSARGDAADDARDRRPHHVLVRHGPPRRRLARLRHGVWRAAGAAAFPRPAVAAELAEPAGFCARAVSASAGRRSSAC